MTLAELVRRFGWSPSDVAFLAGVEESTVSRLWHAEDWSDRIKGKTLRALIAVIPGVGEFIFTDTLKRRREELIDALADVGLVVNMDSFRRLVVSDRIPEQLLANALTAALHVALHQPREAARHLAKFWSRSQDRVLCHLWNDSDSGGIFVDTSPLVQASVSLASTLKSNLTTFHAILGHATLVHYVARATGRKVHVPDSTSIGRCTAMSYRSSAIGHILQTADLEAAQYYHRAIRENTLLRMVEGWSFPTYNRDTAVTRDFSLPGSVLLRNTVGELLRDFETDNEAYFFYLVGTAIPLLLRHDPTLGLRADEVAREVRSRIDTLYEPAARKAACSLIGQLPRPA